MDRDALRRTIENIRNMDSQTFPELRVRRNMVEPILHDLQWNIEDQDEVIFEYGTSGRERVDYALCEKGRLLAFIEAKGARENLSQHQEQLLRYAFEKGVHLAVLTNGLHWWFYLPLKEGDWDARRFCMIDLKSENIDIVCDTFTSFLSKEKVISGEAVQNAQEALKGTKSREMAKKTLPKAWNSLIEKPDSRLVDLIAESTQQLCECRPDPTDVTEFLEHHRSRVLIPENDGLPPPPDDNKGWYYWVDSNGRAQILAFVNAQAACSMRRFDAKSGIFLGQPPNPKGNYQDNFADCMRPEHRLHLSQQPNLAKMCKRKLPDWVLLELEPQIRDILKSEQDR